MNKVAIRWDERDISPIKHTRSSACRSLSHCQRLALQTGHGLASRPRLCASTATIEARQVDHTQAGLWLSDRYTKVYLSSGSGLVGSILCCNPISGPKTGCTPVTRSWLHFCKSLLIYVPLIIQKDTKANGLGLILALLFVQVSCNCSRHLSIT